MAKATKRKRRRRPKLLLEFRSTIPWRGRAEGEPFMAGYLRVSTENQLTQRQVDELVLAGVADVDIWGDVATGATIDPEVRPGLFACMRELEPGDILVIHSIDRLSRDTFDFLTIMRELSERGVSVRILNFGMDLATPIGEFAATIFAAIGQFERRIAHERTMSGLAMARARGVRLGSAKQFTDDMIRETYQITGSVEATAKRLKCSKITVIRGLGRGPRWFEPGQEVVCIDEAWGDRHAPKLTKGASYTVLEPQEGDKPHHIRVAGDKGHPARYSATKFALPDTEAAKAAQEPKSE